MEQPSNIEQTLEAISNSIENVPQTAQLNLHIDLNQKIPQEKQVRNSLVNSFQEKIIEKQPQIQKEEQAIQVKVNINLSQIISKDQKVQPLKINIKDHISAVMDLPITFHQNYKPQQIKTNTQTKKIQESSHKKIISQQIEKLQNNKLIKQIFTHFCKENYISSIKSTLFEDKQKMMEEMNLNKWMVFCKQFDIFSKLCNLKIQSKSKVLDTQTIDLKQKQTSRVRQLKVKEIKQVQTILTQIFKKSASNHTKMQFNHFIQGIDLLKLEFYHQNEVSSLQFAKKYLFCQTPDICLKKLANLKFTFGIPQIDYAKATSTPSQRQKEKNKLLPHQQKQNNDGFTQLPSKTKKMYLNDGKTMMLNSIIKEAKNTLSTLQNKSTITTIRKHATKIKINLDQPKIQKKKVQKVIPKNELLKYFDETQDQILQSYFKCEKKMSTIQK